jgi:hypothetical protein
MELAVHSPMDEKIRNIGGFMAIDMNPAIKPGERQVVDGFAKGRNAGVFGCVQNHGEAVALRIDFLRDVDADWEESRNEIAIVMAIEINMDLKHRSIESENLNGLSGVRQIEDLLVGENPLIGFLIEVVDRFQLGRVRKVNERGVFRKPLEKRRLKAVNEGPAIIKVRIHG